MKKTIFITGTSSGFGKATVELFAKEGWNVVGTVRDTAKHKDLFKNLPNVALFDLDVTNFDQVEKVAHQAIQKFGKIDVVVNNAGYCLMGPTETSTMEQIKEQYETNVFGVFAVTKAFIPHFRENKVGMFINFASASAQFNYPYIAAYGSSKWAVRGMTESLGIELAPFNIEVKAIYPGLHATKIFTKLDDGTGSGNPAFQHYEKHYSIFNSAQTVMTHVTSPDNIAKEVYKAATNKNGKLHIVSGGDAKMYAFLKKILPERMFQKVQIRSIMQPLSKMEISFAKWLFGSRIGKLEVGSDNK
jgi:NAD(P)-dependent dehydrogenase (short-subunit alcohol dehydrogenase family)